MKKYTARVSLVLVFVLQSVFLGAIMLEKTNLPIVFSFVLLIGFLIVFAWRRIPHHSQDHLWEDVWLIGFVAVGAVLTFWLSTSLGSVIAVGLVGVVVSFVPRFFRKYLFAHKIPPAVYCGSFVGMTSPGLAEGYSFVFLAATAAGVVVSFVPRFFRKYLFAHKIPPAVYCGSFVGMTSPGLAEGYSFVFLAATAAGVLLVFSKNVFHGYGGKLGTVAFGGVLLVVIIFELIWK